MTSGQHIILSLNSYYIFYPFLNSVTGVNNSSIKEDFILLGFPDHPNLEKILFMVVLVSYFLTRVENTVIILIFSIDSKLKTPT